MSTRTYRIPSLICRLGLAARWCATSDRLRVSPLDRVLGVVLASSLGMVLAYALLVWASCEVC